MYALLIHVTNSTGACLVATRRTFVYTLVIIPGSNINAQRALGKKEKLIVVAIIRELHSLESVRVY